MLKDQRCETRAAACEPDLAVWHLAGLAGYLKWAVFVGFSHTVNKPIG